MTTKNASVPPTPSVSLPKGPPDCISRPAAQLYVSSRASAELRSITHFKSTSLQYLHSRAGALARSTLTFHPIVPALFLNFFFTVVLVTVVQVRPLLILVLLLVLVLLVEGYAVQHSQLPLEVRELFSAGPLAEFAFQLPIQSPLNRQIIRNIAV